MLELGLKPWLDGSKASSAMRLSHFTQIPALLLTFLTSGSSQHRFTPCFSSPENAAQPLSFGKDPERRSRRAGAAGASLSVSLVVTDQSSSDAMSSQCLHDLVSTSALGKVG